MKTKLTYRVEYPEEVGGGHDEWSVEKGIWDADIDDIMDMIESLLSAAGWHDDSIAALFGEDEPVEQLAEEIHL